MKTNNFLAVASLAALMTGNAYGVVIFDNGLFSGPQTGIGNDTEQRLYDDFSLSNPTLITGFFWQQHDPDAVGLQQTRISIYSGLPETSAPLFTADVTPVRTPNLTGTLFGRSGFDYSVSGLSVALPAGTYWLGLNTIGAFTSWDNTSGTGATIPGALLYNSGFPSGTAVGDFAFQVNGLAHGTTLTVTTSADSGAGSLRNTIAAAASGDTITFAPALNGQTLVLTSGELVITKNLTLLGPGATNLAISGNGLSRVFSINFGVTCTLAGLTITNGNGVGASINFDGGGIVNRGSLTVSNSTLSGNSAAWGGGIFNDGGTLTVQNSTLSSNSAETVGGGIFNSGTLTVQNSTLSGNSALNSDGGGIYSGGNTVTVLNSTLSGNRGGAGGAGGLYAAATERLTNCIVAGNFSGSGTTPSDIVGTVDSAAYNLIGSTGLGATNGNIVLNNTLAITSILDTNLVFNGGPTRTVALVFGSPALNAGLNADAAGLAYDQRGSGFPRIVGGTVDIGAFEFQASSVALRFVEIEPASAGMRLRLQGAPNEVISIQRNTEPGPGGWQPLTSGATDGSGSLQYIDTSNAGQLKRFYRAVRP